MDQWPTVPATISRSQPLTITWSNGYAGALVDSIGQSQVSQGVGADFTCWADAGAGTFTVPAAVLSAMPPTYSSGTQFSAPGIDEGTTQFADGFDVGPITYQ
jgi:hypothetical protein